MSAPERAGSILDTWAARVEAAEWEERLDDELICEGTETDHAEACAILATHRLRATCPGGLVPLLVCRTIAAWVSGQDSEACGLCGRPLRVCWAVTEL